MTIIVQDTSVDTTSVQSKKIDRPKLSRMAFPNTIIVTYRAHFSSGKDVEQIL